MSTARRRPPPWLVAAALVLVALALRLYRLGHEDLWIDEVFQIRVSAQPLGDIVANYRPGVEYRTLTRDQAPLSHLLFHFVVGEGGSEAWVRLPSAVAGALGVGVLFVVAARLLPLEVALLGAVLLALAPLDLWYSQECRFYALWKLEALLAYLALLRALDGGGRRWWGAWVLATVAGMYTCILHGLVVVAQAVTVIWHGRLTGRTRPAALAFAVALAVVAVATLPVSRVVLAETDRPAGTVRPTALSVLPYTFFAYAAGFSLGPTVAALHALPSPRAVMALYPSVPLVFAVFIPVAIAGVWRLGVRSRPAAVLLPWLAVPPLSVFVLSQVSHVVYNVRYALASLPAFLVVIAAGCLAFSTRALRRLAVAGVAACMLASVAGFYWNPAYDREHVRDALAYVRTTEPGGSHVLVVGQVLRALDYYARGSAVTLAAGCEPAVDPLPDHLWLVAGRDWSGLAPGCLARLAPRYRVVDHRGFVGIDLWRLDAAAAAGSARGILAPLEDLDADTLAPEALRLGVIPQVDVDLVALDRPAGILDDVCPVVAACALDPDV